jgi:DNA modification methylase
MSVTITTAPETPCATLESLMPSDVFHKIELRPASELRPLGRKLRSHPESQLAALRKSIAQFGFISPVLIDERGRVLNGLARIEAAKQVGMDQIPTLVIGHLTDAEKRAYAIADNKIGELAGWDKEVLALEFEELQAIVPAFDLTTTGFTVPEIDAIVFSEPGRDDDANDDPSDKPIVSRREDLFILGPHRLLCGDATNREDIIRLMDGDLAKVVFTDVPYNVPIQGHVTSNKSHQEFAMASGEMSEEEFRHFLETSLQRMFEALQTGGVVYGCIDWRGDATYQAAARAVGFELLNMVIWNKLTGGMGSFYRSQHELILVFRKPGATHQNNVQLGKHGRNRSNVWDYEGFNGFRSQGRRELDDHPTPKPVRLVQDALLDCTSRNDVVLDPFNGGGATLIAAEKSGRRARAMELSPTYVDRSIRRWQALTGQIAIHEKTGLAFDNLATSRLTSNGAPEGGAQ